MLFLLLLLLCCQLSLIATTEYYITSLADLSDCPSNTVCNVLSYYTRHQTKYFSDNNVMWFLPGIHLLEQSIVVNGVSNITLTGMDVADNNVSSVITCSDEDKSITFNNHSSFVTVKYITINSCGEEHSVGFDKMWSALYFHDVFNITLDHVELSHDNTIGLLVVNGFGTTYIKSCDFYYHDDTNAHFIYTSLSQCFYRNVTHNLYIEGSVFDHSNTGLTVSMYQKLTYQVRIEMRGVFVPRNAIHGILFNYKQAIYFSVLMRNVVLSFSDTGLYVNGSIAGSEMNFYEQLDSHFSLVLEDSLILSNIVGVSFTQHYADFNQVEVRLINCNISNNSLTGIELSGNEMSRLTLFRMINCTVEGNGEELSGDYGVITVKRLTGHYENIMAKNNYQSVLYLTSSPATFSGSANLFHRNFGKVGGAMNLDESPLLLSHDTYIEFSSNWAYKGGAIFCSQACPILIERSERVTLLFFDNSASTGEDIYSLYPLGNPSCDSIINNSLVQLPNGPIHYSTDANGVCLCSEGDIDNSLLYCSHDMQISVSIVYPGQDVSMSIMTVGDGGKRFIFIDGRVKCFVDNLYLGSYYLAAHQCLNVSYTAYTNWTTIDCSIDSNLYLSFKESRSATMTVIHLPCPRGYHISNNVCKCIDVLQRSEIDCNIQNGLVKVNKNTGLEWYGVVNVSNRSCYVLSVNCRYTYCYTRQMSFDLFTNNDNQCTAGRSGILCSQCIEGNSLLLGSNECGKCSNSYMSLLIVFWLAGVALIAVIVLLNLTVSVGTINGLIFYANVLKMYEDIFFPKGSIPFVSQFVSWINLDFGIKVCLYDGLDSYVKSWLQFAFPVYLWLIIALIVIICRFSVRFSRLLGSRIVPALSTLFLLSYVKLLRSIITVLSPQAVSIDCGNGSIVHQTRWFADSSLHYFELKHCLLLAFALVVLVVFIIPYTILLVASPLLQGKVSRWCNCWNRLIPVFDAYNAPYKDKYRFWTGFMLIARLPILVAVSASNVTEANRMWLLSVVQGVVITILLLHYILGRVYRIWYLNIPEMFYCVNLLVVVVAATNGVFSVAYKVILIVGVSVSFIGFLGIVCFHLYLALSKGGYSQTESKMQALCDKWEERRNRQTSLRNVLGYKKRDSFDYVPLRRETLIDNDNDVVIV